jgi:hypothetical protein
MKQQDIGANGSDSSSTWSVFSRLCGGHRAVYSHFGRLGLRKIVLLGIGDPIMLPGHPVNRAGPRLGMSALQAATY